MDGDLEVQPGLLIAGSELLWSYTTSGGPGGQHANRSKTKAILRFEIETSPSLSPAQRALLVERIGPFVVVEVADNRSQWQNRRIARERLAEQLKAGLRRAKKRRATKPSRRAKQRRVDAKRQRSETKRNRQKPSMD